MSNNTDAAANSEAQKSNSNTKKVRVKIVTPVGIRYLTFIPKPINESSINESLCNICSYGTSICDNLSCPIDPNDENIRFSDFCTGLGSGEILKSDGTEETMDLSNYYPEEGTIEKELGDIIDINGCSIKFGRQVKITEVIDCICPGGCDLYNKEHSQCTSSNHICILRDLLKTRSDGKE